MPAPVHLRFQCPRCQAQNLAADLVSGSLLTCSACGWTRVLSEDDFGESAPSRCLVCTTDDLWRQKDFPQALGFGFVAVGAIGSSIAWFYHRPILALGVLLAVAAIDFLLYAIMPDVLVCYRCAARHRCGDVSDHAAFDHERGERYRQEKLRLAESATAATVDDPGDTSQTPR